MAEIEMTPPCVGSAGSKPFLDDVQAQLTENFHADREGRNPKVLPVQCRLCNGYHQENQLTAANVFPGSNFEEYAYDRIVPKQAGHTYAPDDLLKTAHEAVNPGINPFPDEPAEHVDSEDDNGSGTE